MTEETVQNWLNTTYQDKNVSKIELWNKERGEPGKLTGELKIEGYIKAEEINFERWDKEKFKDEITKVTINNCPQVKKIKFNNNKITEIAFQGTFLNLYWLDLPDNKLAKVNVSKFPNLNRLSVARNPNLTEIEGWENLTKVEFVNLFDTPGLNNQKFNKWKEGINSALGLTPKDSPLPNDWENKLNDLKNRPTQDDLNKAVKDAVSNKEKEYKDYINPNDKDKLGKAAKEAGFIDPKDKNALEVAARKNGMVSQTDLDNSNNKVKDYENGLKGKLGLNDSSLSTWKDEIDKLKKRPTSDNSDQIKNILGLKPNDPLPSDWQNKLVPKTDLDKTKNELDSWKNKFPNETPDTVNKKVGDASQDKANLNEWRTKFPNQNPSQVKKEIDDLKSRPSGSGTGLSAEQQQKLNGYDKLEKQKQWLLNFIKEDKSVKQYNQILQDFNKIR